LSGLKLTVPREVQITLHAEDGLPITMTVQAPVVYAMDGLVVQHAWLRQAEDLAVTEYAQARIAFDGDPLPPHVQSLIAAAERKAFVSGRMIGMGDAVGYLLGGPNELVFAGVAYDEYVRRRKTGEQTHESAFAHYGRK
jgi:hypothetical protein